MYEYVAQFERWKKTNLEYKLKFSEISEFSQNCVKKCNSELNNKNSSENLNLEECINACKRPVIDIERFNLSMIKRLTIDVYEICSNKLSLSNLNFINSNKNHNDKNDLYLLSQSQSDSLMNDINKMKICVENLYRENEILVKKETLERIDDIIKFLKI